MTTTNFEPKSLAERLNKPRRRKKAAYALIFVLMFTAVGLVALGGALQWTSSNARQTERNNNYFIACAAAEAATEKVLTSVSTDFQGKGEGEVYNKLGTYRSMTPTSGDDSYWGNITFSNAKGGNGASYIDRTTSWMYTNLVSQYAGLKGMAATYRIVSNASVPQRTGPPIVAGLRQDVQVASVPIFQFAIFYTPDLEINPGPPMTVNGRVHGNSAIWLQPQADLTFLDHITSVGTMQTTKSPLDPTSRTPGTVIYKAEHDAKVSSLTLPIGTNNSPAAVHSVVEIPPTSEDPTSAIGKQRYYNKADCIVLVSNTTVTVKSGYLNNFATVIPWLQAKSFIATNVSFYNKREGKTVQATQIDVAALRAYNATNILLGPLLGRDISSIYVADMRSQTSSTESGVKLVNGQTLPNLGLTVASPNPVYIQGNYNCPTAALGTTNTAGTRPASVIGDAVTILSKAWNDSNSSKGLSNRIAQDTTVNAALLAGIVPSNGTYYSGGVENFPRFLEDWSGGVVFTYNGSMVVMYYSQIATAPWGGSDVYSPPTRRWSFDFNFMDATKLPPCTPSLLTTIRASWAMIQPGKIM